jgi:hypothetical protein
MPLKTTRAPLASEKRRFSARMLRSSAEVTETYPGIRAEAEQTGATIYFCDEAGIRSDYHAGTTWAPFGRTPVMKTIGARHAVNMISAVTTKGALRFAVYLGTLNAEVFIDFCRRLLHDASWPVLLIVDGHPAHRATATKSLEPEAGQSGSPRDRRC